MPRPQDCDELGAALHAFYEARATAFQTLKAAAARETPEDKRAFEEKYGARKQELAKKASGLKRCRGNAAVTAAIRLIAF